MRSAEQEGEANEAKEVKEPKKELVTSGSLQRLLSRSSSEHNVRVRGGSKRHSLLYDVRLGCPVCYRGLATPRQGERHRQQEETSCGPRCGRGCPS